jgi:hypothetical protein
LRLRLFLTVAGGLIAMIYLQPAAALRLAALMPGSGVIAAIIAVAAVGGFALRLALWQAGGRRG